MVSFNKFLNKGDTPLKVCQTFSIRYDSIEKVFENFQELLLGTLKVIGNRTPHFPKGQK